MRYRLMASYFGASYQAAVGPSDRDITLLPPPRRLKSTASPPPPAGSGASRSC